MRYAAFLLLMVAAFISPRTGGRMVKDKKPAPPTAKDLVGVWIGFDNDELTFTRLDLRADSTGFCARVSPADTILHDQGIHVYRITNWSLNGEGIEIQTSPASNATAIGYVKGRIDIASLRLVIGGPENGGWKEEALLEPESRILTSNQETRDAIEKTGATERTDIHR